MDDLKRKGDDMDRVADLSQDLQNLMNVRLKWIIIQFYKILTRECIGNYRHDIERKEKNP